MKKISVVLLAILLGFVIYKISTIHKVESSKEEPSDLVIHEAGDCFILDDNFTFCIPVKSISSEKKLLEMQNENEFIRLMFIQLPDSTEEPSSVCVSAYQKDENTSKDSAFYNVFSKRNIEDTEKNYQVISFGKYKVGGITLYQKTVIRGGDFCNVIHYFMEEDSSSACYEIKVGGSPSDIEKLKAIAERVAISTRFAIKE